MRGRTGEQSRDVQSVERLNLGLLAGLWHMLGTAVADRAVSFSGTLGLRLTAAGACRREHPEGAAARRPTSGARACRSGALG